jgi:aromatic ring-cleaving dioxygenase
MSIIIWKAYLWTRFRVYAKDYHPAATGPHAAVMYFGRPAYIFFNIVPFRMMKTTSENKSSEFDSGPACLCEQL